jgi:hypothetical protein
VAQGEASRDARDLPGDLLRRQSGDQEGDRSQRLDPVLGERRRRRPPSETLVHGEISQRHRVHRAAQHRPQGVDTVALQDVPGVLAGRQHDHVRGTAVAGEECVSAHGGPAP